jgi:hypothetical protein
MSRLNDFTDHPDGIVWNASLVMLNHFRYGSFLLLVRRVSDVVIACCEQNQEE